MAYATYSDFVNHWGTARTASLVSGSAALRQSVIGEALSAAEADIDGAAQDGGFTVPVVGSDLSSNATVATRIEAKLKMCTILLATFRYVQGLDATEAVKDGRKHCQAFLDLLAQGKGLPGVAVTRSGALALISQPGASAYMTQERLRDARLAQS